MFDLIYLIKTAGYLGLFGIVFAESGLLLGFFLPGDSLLFTAGFLASQGFLNIWLLMPLMFIGAALGDNVGYAFGFKIGPMLFTKEESIFFHKDHVERARGFYEKYGPKTLVLARFMPGIRTFVPILAGVGKMHYPTFMTYNLVGGALWGIGMPLLGYLLGNTIPNIDRYLIPIVITIIILSLLPSSYHIFKEKEERQRIWALVKKKFFKNG